MGIFKQEIFKMWKKDGINLPVKYYYPMYLVLVIEFHYTELYQGKYYRLTRSSCCSLIKQLVDLKMIFN